METPTPTIHEAMLSHYLVQMAEHLVTGDQLPSLYGTDLEGNQVDITASVAGRWAVILFYRGDW